MLLSGFWLVLVQEAINSIMPQSFGMEESCQSMEGGSEPVFGEGNCSRSHSSSPATPPSFLPSATKEVIINFVWDDGSLPLAIPVNHKIGNF